MQTIYPPRMTETPVDAWAHCPDPRCDGNGQQSVRGVRTLVEHTIGSRGGDGPFVQLVENTNEYLRFADDTDAECSACGSTREISEQPRPTIPIITGFPQNGLLGAPKFDPGLKFSPEDQKHAEEMAVMRAQMAEMAEKLTKLTGDDD